MKQQPIEKIDMHQLLPSTAKELMFISKINTLIEALNSLLPDVEEKKCKYPKCLTKMSPSNAPDYCPDHNEMNIPNCEDEYCVREKGHTGFHWSKDDLPPHTDVEEKKCCEKCIKHPKSDLVCKGFCGCHHEPPHTPVVEGWEERFEKMAESCVNYHGDISWKSGISKDTFKDFISQLLTSARSEERQRIREKMIVIKHNKQTLPVDAKTAYYEAFADILALTNER